MTFFLTTVCDTAAIYGPCAAAFGMEPWHESIQNTYDLLCGNKLSVSGYPLWEKESLKDEDHPLVPYNVTEEKEIRMFGTKDAQVQLEGRLVGGCMDCLVNMLGTPFEDVAGFNERYKEDGIIWFLESCDLNVMAIRRAIWQMKNAGWFEHVKGFLIGRPLCFGQEIMGLDQYRAVIELLEEYQVPILMDLDIGHLAPMMPMLSGAYAKINAQGNEIMISYELK